MRFFLFLVAACVAWTGPTQRIVSTAPSITETLFAIGLGSRVVGVTNYCRYPEEVRKLPKIGTFLTPDVEAIVGLRPDLVVVYTQPNRLKDELRRLHISTLEVQSDTLQQIYEGALKMGQAAGVLPAAEAFVHKSKSELESMRSKTAGVRKETALFLVGHTPGRLEDIYASAGTSYFSELLSYVGAIDVLHDSVAPYPKISREEIISRNPDFIFDLAGTDEIRAGQELELWRNLGTLKAFARKHIYTVPADPFDIPGPRAVQAARLLLHDMHPELQP